MNTVQQEVFSLRQFSVVKASYKDSEYYIAGSYDITSYVKDVQEDHTKVDKNVLQNALNMFLKRNPDKNKLNVPQYDFILLDDPTTTAQFVYMYCNDVLHYTDEKIEKVIDDLNSVGYFKVGTYSDEMAQTLGHLLEAGNVQLKQNLGWDKLEVTDSDKDYTAASLMLENLIRRDYPMDI